MQKVESFKLDHTKVKAPYIRKCCELKGTNGDIVTKFDLRFLQPNEETFGTAAIHGLEHLLATYLRETLDGIIDLSPMGCRTGFYMILAGDLTSNDVLQLVKDMFLFIKNYEGDIPGASARDCGNYLDLNLYMAKFIAAKYYDILSNITPEQLVYPE